MNVRANITFQIAMKCRWYCNGCNHIIKDTNRNANLSLKSFKPLKCLNKAISDATKKVMCYCSP